MMHCNACAQIFSRYFFISSYYFIHLKFWGESAESASTQAANAIHHESPASYATAMHSTYNILYFFLI